jgi:alcohol dehydrogenase YqhD (iron-dependent ADH family)
MASNPEILNEIFQAKNEKNETQNIQKVVKEMDKFYEELAIKTDNFEKYKIRRKITLQKKIIHKWKKRK